MIRGKSLCLRCPSVLWFVCLEFVQLLCGCHNLCEFIFVSVLLRLEDTISLKSCIISGSYTLLTSGQDPSPGLIGQQKSVFMDIVSFVRLICFLLFFFNIFCCIFFLKICFEPHSLFIFPWGMCVCMYDFFFLRERRKGNGEKRGHRE